MSNYQDFKILVVDDDADIREILTLYFKNKGYKTEEATSGNEAFRLVKANDYDLIITDYLMKDGNGIELLERINALEDSKVPVVMISKTTDISQDELQKNGCRAFLEKPIDRRKILKIAEEILEIEA